VLRYGRTTSGYEPRI